MSLRLSVFILLAFITIFMVSCSDISERTGEIDMCKTIIIAHRGAPSVEKGNTMESFKRAVHLGADMIEFDVRRTKDGVLIVHHDEFLQGKRIKELTYEETLEKTKDEGWSIPTFEEVLRYTSGKIKLDVEVKEEGYEKVIVESISKYFKKDQFIMTSFYDSCIKRIKDDYPNIKAGLILGISKPKNPIVTRLSEFFPMGRCKKAKADLLVAHWRLLRFGFLKRVKRENQPVFVWTVNDQAMIWTLLHDERIDGIITDRLELTVSLKQRINLGKTN